MLCVPPSMRFWPYMLGSFIGRLPGNVMGKWGHTRHHSPAGHQLLCLLLMGVQPDHACHDGYK